MSKFAVKEEKVFRLYSNVPEDLRREIVNEMSAVDRCRFSGCSDLANKDAKDCKDYVYALEINLTSKYPNIIVRHGPYDKMARKSVQGYILTYKQELGIVECMSLEWRNVLWTSELDTSLDVHQYVYQHFKNLLQQHQNKIKKLVVDVSKYNDILPEIQKLNRLERLQVFDDTDVLELLSKTRRTLTHLQVFGEKNGRLLEKCEEIYRIQEQFYSPDTRVNYHQFLRFAASDVTTHIGDMGPMDIVSIVRAWQDGRMDFDCYDWYLHGSNFNVLEFIRLLGIDDEEWFVEHYRDDRKIMRIYTANFGPKRRTLTLKTYKDN